MPNNSFLPLPTWTQCEQKSDAKNANPIEKFIYDQEPADGVSGGREWRQQLQRALLYAAALGDLAE